MANKPGFDGDFTITDVENISNQWSVFPNNKSIAFNGVIGQCQLTVAGAAPDLSFGANAGGTVEPKMSFCAWIKSPFGTWPMAAYISIATKSSSVTPSEYNWFINTDGLMQFFLQDVTFTPMIYASETAVTIPPGQWTHVCVTYDGTLLASGIQFYVNGVPVATTAAAPTVPPYGGMHATAAEFAIGRLYGDLTTNVSEGFIDELAAFKKKLSADEVAEVYNSGAAFDFNTFSSVADLVSWWRMGDKATGVSPNFTIPDQVGSNDAVMSAFLGDSTSGVVADTGTGAITSLPITQVPISLASKGILFRNRSKPYLVSNGGTPDDIII